MKDLLLEKFLRYISYDTQSDPESDAQPSTAKQLTLLSQLQKELAAMGLADAVLDNNGYVMAHLPANIDKPVPAIGFIAHVDVSPDAPAANIKPQIVQDYDGGKIRLNPDCYLDPAEFPEMLHYKGQTLITTDGTTLLGADDKAGVAEIMCALHHLITHPELPHGRICVAFTPDEEIGRGTACFNIEKFDARYAYTMDGGEAGELEFENFNAAQAKINIQGRNVHPGYAKDKMRNALQMAMELNALLPPAERPEHTTGYEGFFHLTNLSGTVEEAKMQYIIRDHCKTRFEERKQILLNAVDFLNTRYGNTCFHLELKDQYYNMRQEVEPHRHIIDKAVKAMEMAGVKPKVVPIRGGTDGAMLSFMGLPCPNIFAGGLNFHGKMEFVPLESMEKATYTILNLVHLFATE